LTITGFRIGEDLLAVRIGVRRGRAGGAVGQRGFTEQHAVDRAGLQAAVVVAFIDEWKPVR
jgi:hypothetical protein